jgi:hypothetical protein
MIRHRPPHEVLEDLRLALEVMEEKSHAGLDTQAADVLRNRILAQISKVESLMERERAAVTTHATPTLGLSE